MYCVEIPAVFTSRNILASRTYVYSHARELFFDTNTAVLSEIFYRIVVKVYNVITYMLVSLFADDNLVQVMRVRIIFILLLSIFSACLFHFTIIAILHFLRLFFPVCSEYN